jgi:uncharacterized hydrophobic protein (TIGR00271 family)
MTKRKRNTFAVRSPVRRSYQVGATGGVLIAIGTWLVIGVFGLSGSALQVTGSQTAWAFLMAGLLFLPTALSWAELMSWVRGAGGSYRLVRAADRPILTFLNGLAHLLGWVALSALIADVFAWYADGLLKLLLPTLPDRRLVALPLVLFLALANRIGYRSRRRAQVFFLGSSAVVLLIIAALMVPRVPDASVVTAFAPSNRLFASVVLLIAATWATDVTFEMQSIHRRPSRVLLIGGLVGPGIALLVMLLTRQVVSLSALVTTTLPLLSIVEEGTIVGATGVPIVLGFGTLVTAVAFEIVTLASLRQTAAMGFDGWLPDWLRRPHPRYNTPARIILLQSLLVLTFVAFGSVMWLGQVSAMAFLTVSIGVNVAALLLSDHPDAENRSFRLPLGGLLPTVGIGINLLLFFALPWPVLLLGVLWLGLGFAAFYRRGREQRHIAQRGVTVFEEEDEEHPAYNVLVPIANPKTDAHLLTFGEAIARQHDGRLIALHVVYVPDQLRLDSGRLAARNNLEALELITDEMEEHGVPIHAVTRLSRSIAQGVLDTMTEENPDLIVMGWHARPTTGIGLGHILDEVVANATCDVVVVRGDWPQQPPAILVPMGGGPNAPLAAELAQALTAEEEGQVSLLNVVRSPARRQDIIEAEMLLAAQIESLPSSERLEPRVVAAESPVQGILSEAEGYAAVMLGASEESFLDQALFGQVPQLIARQTDSPVAMIRRHRGLPAFWVRKVWESASSALPSLERDDQLAVYQRLRRGARASINYFVLITLSAIIATLGLLLNSPAVIIGAMLVAPLMTPIVATAIGISFGDARTLRLSIASTVQGVLAAIFIAIIITAISPIKDIALASGMAGAYAIARKEVGEALPGVAIAAALMPPVCTIGIGIALANFGVALGATLLFTTNLIAITLAAAIIFLLLGIRPPQERARRQTLQRGLTTSLISLMIVSLPLAYILFRTTASDQMTYRVTQAVEAETADWENVRLESLNIERQRDLVTVSATVRTSHEVTQADADALDKRLEEALDEPVRVQLFVVPVSDFDSASSQ